MTDSMKRQSRRQVMKMLLLMEDDILPSESASQIQQLPFESLAEMQGEEFSTNFAPLQEPLRHTPISEPEIHQVAMEYSSLYTRLFAENVRFWVLKPLIYYPPNPPIRYSPEISG
ncbi:hypothetical protein V1505DRAFT_387145 [Lipomyces doorenjongii]